MNLLSRRSRLAIAAMVDIAVHAGAGAVSARQVEQRLGLPPRHLETMFQGLVRAGLLKGVRGPRGGYELARERRRMSAGEIVRAVMAGDADVEETWPETPLLARVVAPPVAAASAAFLSALDEIGLDRLCRDADAKQVFGRALEPVDFTI